MRQNSKVALTRSIASAIWVVLKVCKTVTIYGPELCALEQAWKNSAIGIHIEAAVSGNALNRIDPSGMLEKGPLCEVMDRTNSEIRNEPFNVSKELFAIRPDVGRKVAIEEAVLSN
jgi:hypothetical protein